MNPPIQTKYAAKIRKRQKNNLSVDEALSKWFSKIMNHGIRVPRSILKVIAEELTQKISNKQFIATDSWLSRWKKK